MRLERRERVPALALVAAPVAAILAALSLCSILIALAGASVLAAYGTLLNESFGGRLGITETLTRATPLIFTGLAAAVAFRARFWNIGAEGQFYMGAIAVAALGSINFGLSPMMEIPLLLVCGALAGACFIAGPAILKVQFGVDEVVTTLLLNFVAILLVSLLVEGPMRDPLSFGWPQSEPIIDTAVLPHLVERSRLHWGFVLALLAAAAVAFLHARSVFGLSTIAVGLSAPAARHAGIKVERVLIMAALGSGMLAGLGGAVEVMGLKGYVTTDLSPGYGAAGVIVAMLASLNPLGIVPAAVFVAAMFVGADAMARAHGVPSFIADVIVATSLLSMLVALFLAEYRVRR
ncbi:MAG TPA: ABC transporter permease [Geminicoccus sp.]|jgi:simple sugar transport system permease protein|uniref:ABC transporter permease n=1 Tax=Geminicoccus sp. TaxID=2024832 RepID=UPI002E375CE7|nr:ABC transporter permease [Geminicoccus sp.]HEX2527139.1 ABC transporter permease [Geminicoccus sp.]